MKTKSFFVIVITSIVFSLSAQTPPEVKYLPYLGTNNDDEIHQYGTSTEFPTTEIADDFGPRQLKKNSYTFKEYDWHGGVDYNSNINDGNNDFGNLLLAVEGGNILEDGVLASEGYKRIVVEGEHNFAYVHIFKGGSVPSNGMKVGGCILKYLNSPYDNTWVIIFQINGSYTAIAPHKDYPNGPPVASFTDDSGDLQTISVETSVSQGDPVAPLGNSGTLGAHLHLQISTQGVSISDGYAKDPLGIVKHDEPAYNIEILKENDETAGITLDYPGTNESTIQVRVGGLQNTEDATNRYTSVMNIDEVEILIKKENLNNPPYSLIQGPYYESKFSHGARLNTQRKNMDLVLTNNDVGNWEKTHMQPFAYAGLSDPYVHHPWDEYYFADFATRIHKDDTPGAPLEFASCPQDALYNDGNYTVKARVTTVNGNPYESQEEYPIIIDNFKPFIQRVQMVVNGNTIYTSEWICNDCGGISFNEGPTTPLNLNDLAEYGMIIQVDVSEPLSSLQLDIPYLDLEDVYNVPSSGGLHYTFLTGAVSSDNIDHDASNALRFIGEDFDEDGIGNKLLDLSDHIESECLILPTRGNEGWDNIETGVDTVHLIPVTNDVSCPTITLAPPVISNPTSCGANDGSIVFEEQPNGGTAPYIGQWKDGNGNLISSGASGWMSINGLSTGTYTLTISDANGCAVESDFDLTSGSSGAGGQDAELVWAKQLSASGFIHGYSIALDANGNIFITGKFKGTVDFDPNEGTYLLTSTGSIDIFLSKLDPSGNFLWAKQLSGPSESIGIGESISVDDNGNVYIGGFFVETVDFDPGPETFLMTAIGYISVFVSKFDPSGNFLWAKQLGGCQDNYLTYRAVSIDVDLNGNIFVGGQFNGTVDFDPGPATFLLTSTEYNNDFIAKLDSNGDFLWVKQLNNVTHSGNRYLTTDNSGNVYTIGSFFNTVDFDPNEGVYNLTSFGINDIFVLKLDSSGNFIWTKKLGGTNSDRGKAISVDFNENVYLGGEFNGVSDFDPGMDSYFLIEEGGQSDVFISKLDSNGDFLWAKQFGGNYIQSCKSIELDILGNIYSVGYFESTVDFDPGIPEFNLTPAVLNSNFISKLNSNGEFIWAKQIGGENVFNFYFYSIVVDNNQNVYSTGNFKGTVDFDPNESIYNLSSIGYSDMYISKMGNISSCDEGPSINCPEDITILSQSNNCGTVVSFSVPATDDCNGLEVYTSFESGDFFPVGMTTVYCTATDTDCNIAECSFTITVTDNEPPQALCQNKTAPLDVSGIASIDVSDIDNGSSDACGIADMSLSNYTFNCEDVGNNTVTLSVTDVNENVSICTAVVTVEDNLTPIALCQNGKVKLNSQGTGSITIADINNGSTDACGISNISLSQTNFDCSDLGINTVTLTVTDNNGNSNNCTAEVEVVDVIPPVVSCQSATVTLDPEGVVSINPFTIGNGSYDNCGISLFNLSNIDFFCDDLGTNLVTLTAFDPSGNSNTCTAMITVQKGTDLPSQWGHSDIDQANGDAVYDPCEESFTINSSGYSSPYIDEQHLAYQEICGDAEIIAHVESIDNPGRAGVEFRETLDPESKMVSLKTYLSLFVTRSYRATTGGNSLSKNLLRFGHSWLKIVRSGNSFTGYTSSNGINWTSAFSVFISMENCIYVGLFTESNNVNTVTTAVFDNVMVNGNNNYGYNAPIQPPTPTGEAEAITKSGLNLYPNPTGGLLNVDLERVPEEPVWVEILDVNGQVLYYEKHDMESGALQLNIEAMNIPAGMYLLNIRTQDGVMSGRFVKG